MTNLKRFNEYATSVYNLNKRTAPFVSMEYGVNYCDGEGTIDFFRDRPTLKAIQSQIADALAAGVQEMCIDIIGRIAYTMEEVKYGDTERHEESCVYVILEGKELVVWVNCEDYEVGA